MRLGGWPSLRRWMRPSPGPAGEHMRSISRPVNTLAYRAVTVLRARGRVGERACPWPAPRPPRTPSRRAEPPSSEMASVGQAATHFPQPSHQGPLSIAYAPGTERSAGRCAALRSPRGRPGRGRASRGDRPARSGRRRCSARGRHIAARLRTVTRQLPAPAAGSSCWAAVTVLRVQTARRSGREWSSRSGEIVGRVQPGPCRASPRQSRQLCRGNIVPSLRGRAAQGVALSTRSTRSPGVGEVQRRLLAGDAAADHQDGMRRARSGRARVLARAAISCPPCAAASTNCTRSMTRMRSSCAFTALARVRTHCGQAETQVARRRRPRPGRPCVRRPPRSARGKRSPGPPAPAAQGVLAVVLHLHEGEARELPQHLARLARTGRPCGPGRRGRGR